MTFVQKHTPGFVLSGKWFELDHEALPSWLAWFDELRSVPGHKRSLYPSEFSAVEVARYLPPGASQATKRLRRTGEHLLTGRRMGFRVFTASEVSYFPFARPNPGNYLRLSTVGVDQELTLFSTVNVFPESQGRWSIVIQPPQALDVGLKVVEDDVVVRS